MIDTSKLEQTVRALEVRVATLEKYFERGTPVVAAPGKKESAKEFLLGKNVGSEAQKVLALAYFAERHERLTSFNVPDLETVFRAAREKLPKNLNDTVNKNVARGFLMEADRKKDSKKAWQLTATGERHVEQKMGRSQ